MWKQLPRILPWAALSIFTPLLFSSPSSGGRGSLAKTCKQNNAALNKLRDERQLTHYTLARFYRDDAAHSALQVDGWRVEHFDRFFEYNTETKREVLELAYTKTRKELGLPVPTPDELQRLNTNDLTDHYLRLRSNHQGTKSIFDSDFDFNQSGFHIFRRGISKADQSAIGKVTWIKASNGQSSGYLIAEIQDVTAEGIALVRYREPKTGLIYDRVPVEFRQFSREPKMDAPTPQGAFPPSTFKTRKLGYSTLRPRPPVRSPVSNIAQPSRPPATYYRRAGHEPAPGSIAYIRDGNKTLQVVVTKVPEKPSAGSYFVKVTSVGKDEGRRLEIGRMQFQRRQNATPISNAKLHPGRPSPQAQSGTLDGNGTPLARKVDSYNRDNGTWAQAALKDQVDVYQRGATNDQDAVGKVGFFATNEGYLPVEITRAVKIDGETVFFTRYIDPATGQIAHNVPFRKGDLSRSAKWDKPFKGSAAPEELSERTRLAIEKKKAARVAAARPQTAAEINTLERQERLGFNLREIHSESFNQVYAKAHRAATSRNAKRVSVELLIDRDGMIINIDDREVLQEIFGDMIAEGEYRFVHLESAPPRLSGNQWIQPSNPGFRVPDSGLTPNQREAMNDLTSELQKNFFASQKN